MPAHKIVPDGALDAKGLDLMMQMFKYAPQERISCRAALKHPYFEGL